MSSPWPAGLCPPLPDRLPLPLTVSGASIYHAERMAAVGTHCKGAIEMHLNSGRVHSNNSSVVPRAVRVVHLQSNPMTQRRPFDTSNAWSRLETRLPVSSAKIQNTTAHGTGPHTSIGWTSLCRHKLNLWNCSHFAKSTSAKTIRMPNSKWTRKTLPISIRFEGKTSHTVIRRDLSWTKLMTDTWMTNIQHGIYDKNHAFSNATAQGMIRVAPCRRQ